MKASKEFNVKNKVFTIDDVKSIIKWINKNYSKIEDELATPYDCKELPDTFFEDVLEETLIRAINNHRCG